jgi:aryl-alcohol dehydrogenase-like predicted oxidoreductase
MHYRRLGRSGLKVSEPSFGSWVTDGNQLKTDTARDGMAAAYPAGVNFFDNAEVYAKGESETIMGDVPHRLGWRRASYIVKTPQVSTVITGASRVAQLEENLKALDVVARRTEEPLRRIEGALAVD